MTGVTEKSFMCQMFMCLFRPLFFVLKNIFAVFALLCYKNLCCASRFCTGGREIVGSRSEQPHRGQNWKIGNMTFLGLKMPFWGSLLEPFKWHFWGI